MKPEGKFPKVQLKTAELSDINWHAEIEGFFKSSIDVITKLDDPFADSVDAIDIFNLSNLVLLEKGSVEEVESEVEVEEEAKDLMDNDNKEDFWDWGEAVKEEVDELITGLCKKLNPRSSTFPSQIVLIQQYAR